MPLKQLSLFEPEEIKPVVIPVGMRCKNCIHMIRNMYNKNLKYCSKQNQKGTSTGKKKIGSNDSAVGCIAFNPINKKQL